MRNDRVLLIAREGGSTNLLHQALATRFPLHVIIEDPPSKIRLLRSRIRRLGIWRVFGQILFQLLIAAPLRLFSARRRAAIIRQAGLDPGWIPAAPFKRTTSVNSTDCLEMVRDIGPSVIVINGTRILNSRTLTAFGSPVLNVHAGITPRYRGVHGGYWALAKNDPQHCGVTVHLVDSGIDTGGILYQSKITPTPKDNFTTYPVMQMTVGSKLLVNAVGDVIAGDARIIQGTSDSHRWYHPTLGEYLWNLLRSGVR